MPLLLIVSVAAMATEPSGVKVTVDGKNYYLHTVVRGDTLYSLSKAYGVTTHDIVECNDNLTASTLKAGNKLLIPYKEVADLQRDTIDSKRFRLHTVAKGETLYSIARKYKISLSTLEADNPGIEPNKLEVGSELRLRRSEIGYTSAKELEKESRKRDDDEPVKAGVAKHVVKRGETLYSISRRYGISSRDLLHINNLKSHRDIKVGMTIFVDIEAEGETAQAEPPTESVAAAEERVESVDSTATAPREIIDEQRAEAEEYGIFAGEGLDGEVNPVEVAFPPLPEHHTLKVALMLPFHVRDNKINPNYVDLYKGVLLAMEDLKAEGYTIELSVFDTRSSASNIADIVNYEPGFYDAQLIIGPVHEGEIRHVLNHAEANEVPVVTPLADMEALRSPVLFQLQAEESHRFDKLAELFDGSREIITIYAGGNDWNYAEEIVAMSANSPRRNLNFVFDRESFFYHRIADGSNGEEVIMEDLMRTPSEKLFVVVASSETDVDRILTTLSSTKASIAGRGLTYGDYSVLGNRKWLNMKNIDRQSFFKNNVLFVVPYHAKRHEEVVRYFDGRYVEAYGTLPSMFAYRGYDAAMLFCRRMFMGIDTTFGEELFSPLTTAYRFRFEDGLYVNTEWTVEQYRSNFSIETR